MEQYGIYPSQHIRGVRPVSRKMDEFCLRENSLDLFFQEARKQVERSSRGDIDGEEYENYLGSWKITFKHHYQVHDEQGGDNYCGVFETYPGVDRDELEVIGAFDEKYDQELPGLVCKLNEFYKRKNY